jgi:uncharacterized protein
MNTKSERFEMRLEPALLDHLDEWRESQGGHVSRAEAVRSLIDKGLEQAKQPKFSDGEKLITLMLCELLDQLKIKGEFDTSFISSAIHGGHYWALDWELQGVFHGHTDKRATVREVVDILDMWSFLEEAYEALDAAEQAAIEAGAGPLGKHVRFSGFDGNNESEHMGVARFLVEKMGRYQRFGGKRSLNSHSQSVDGYLRMFAVFEPIRAKLVGRRLAADEIVAILNARRYTG